MTNKAPVKFCWHCGKQLYQRKVSESLKIDGYFRTLHKTCAREIDRSKKYTKILEYRSPGFEQSCYTIVNRLEPEYKNPVCRGSVLLGSACGVCERCEWHKNKL